MSVGALLREVGLDDAVDVAIDGHDPVLASRFPVGEAAAEAIGASAAAAALVGGRPQRVRVNVPHAAASLISFLLQRIEPAPDLDMSRERALTALFQTRDDRWIHLHGGFAHLDAASRAVLGIGAADDPAPAVARWDAPDLEDALADARVCGAIARDAEEWDAHPQAQALVPLGLVDIAKLSEGEARRMGAGERPLAGVRVLDMTRVLAGPTVGRTLAEHGADVLLVNSPALPNVPPFVIDTGHGKRSAFCDLDDPAAAAGLASLATGADVFVQGYRPGALARRGLGAEDLAASHAGLVVVEVSCYGAVGPWAERAGWEQMAESATGLAVVQGAPGPPALIPAAPCDYITGYLGALGALAALHRRAVEGGSYRVRVSLCQTGRWIRDLGARCDQAAATGIGSVPRITTDSIFGRISHLAPVAQMSATPARWECPPVPLGTHALSW
ncbi:MAG: CoA transferase [Acidimicrobiia bacterium]